MKPGRMTAQAAHPICRPLTGPRCALRSACGFTYIALLAAIVIIGITMTAAGKYWQHVMMREKEEELLFRGDQYRQAIERYYTAIPTSHVPPQSIENLLNDDRTPQGKRHLRKQYKDPMTGEDFELIRDMTKGNRIVGVFSKSEREPLKQADSPEPYKEFEGKKSYRDWKFTLNTAQTVTVPGLPGGMPVPPGGAPVPPGGMPAPPPGTPVPPGSMPGAPGGTPVLPGGIPIPAAPPPSGNPFATP